jgi:hypothetical protein
MTTSAGEEVGVELGLSTNVLAFHQNLSPKRWLLRVTLQVNNLQKIAEHKHAYIYHIILA